MVKSVLTSNIAKFYFKAICKVTSLIDMDGGNLSLTCDGKAGSEGISISLLELSFRARKIKQQQRKCISISCNVTKATLMTITIHLYLGRMVSHR